MSTLSAESIAGLVMRHTGDERRAAAAVATALGESGGVTNARATNRMLTGAVNTDRGLWQISSIFHPQISDATADDPEAATAYAAKISRGFSDLSPWVAYSSGAYRRHLPAAEAGVKAARSPGAVDSTLGAVAGAAAGGVLGVPGAVVGGLVGKQQGVSAIGGGVIDAGKGVVSGLDAVGGFVSSLSQRSTWVRVVYVVAGLGMLAGGGLLLSKDTVVGAAAMLPGPTGVAAKVATAAGAVK